MLKNLTFEQYKKNVFNLLKETGLAENQVQILADYMATVDFYGVKSHGVKTLNAHISKINGNLYNLNPDFTVEKETSAFAVVNGDNSIGMVCGDFCVKYAIEKVKNSGIFTVFSHNNNTYGSAFYYALKAAEEGYICYTASNSPAQMAPFNGKEKMLGTNPFSFVIPAKENPPIIIDMATSVVAKSKINEYKANNKEIPEGWALDKEGNPTTNPDDALGGLMLPMAGFKGYGISLIIDIISGLLSGASYLNHVGRFYSENAKAMDVGFYFVIIDPIQVFGKDFYSKMDNYIKEIRDSAAIGDKKIILPGDDRISSYNKNIKDGLDFEI